MIKNHIVYSNFCDWQFSIKKAHGSFIWTEAGKKLIDFTSGWNVTNLGWNNPEVNEAIIEQAKKNTYSAMWMEDEVQKQYAQELTNSLPKKLGYLLRTTGGTDANEKAMLVARTLTKRQTIIGFLDTYHGHSFGTISIGYRPEYIKDVAPVVPKFVKLPFPKTSGDEKQDQLILKDFAQQLEHMLKTEDVAAIVTEAGIITGWGSTYLAPQGYLSLLRKLTQKYSTLLILDEVGTGFSRCGKLFGMERENIVPDIATFAKGLSNGAAAISAVAISTDFDEKVLSGSKTNSTFGWTSVGCAAALKVLEIHKRDKVWEQAAINGKFLLGELKKQLADHPQVELINGLGMEIGLTFVTDKTTHKLNDELAKKIIARAYKMGLHLIFGGDGNIQIMPPLTTPKNVLEEGIEILVEAVKSNS